MNFKSILLAAAIGLTTLGVVPEAQAKECKLYPDFSLCMEMVGRQGSYNTWDITVINRHWTEEMQVVCNNRTMDNWSSRGGASQAEAQRLAEAFCAI
jgi:hypothetical protein